MTDNVFMLDYLDRTGDVQTPVMAVAHAVPKRFKDERASRWLETYE